MPWVAIGKYVDGLSETISAAPTAIGPTTPRSPTTTRNRRSFPSEDPSQRYLLVADGTNNEVRIVIRLTGEVTGAFGRPGRQAGDFHWVHNIAIDSQGSVYTSEVDTGKRVQRFVRAP